jgi:tetratricopeptide (TPR) repeat protein
MRATALALLLPVLLGLTAPQGGSEERPEVAARRHYIKGVEHYKTAAYEEAIAEFEAGYKLVPKPQFLLNLGQAYRKLDRLETAREMFVKFLNTAPPRPSIASSA